ncbi:MAG: PKD domain-containing protein [Bacteroidia bacterium]
MSSFIRNVCLMFLLFLVVQTSYATDIMGFDMTYECISPCRYKINHVKYHDCCGGTILGQTVPVTMPPIPNPTNPRTPPFGQFSMQGFPTGCSPLPTLVQPGWVVTLITDVTPVCNNFISNCQANPTNPNFCGSVEIRRSVEIDVCGNPGSIPCTKFTLSYQSNARNSIITSGAANQGLFTNSTTIDLGVTPCNNSPSFLEPPVTFICLAAGRMQTYNQGAFDPDGDSLVYRLIVCKGRNGVNVPYNPNYTFLQPLGPNWDVQIDSRTGDISFDPQPGSLEIGVICIEVLEYRNNILIGSVIRDMQVQVQNLNCGQPPQYVSQNHTLGTVPITPPSNTFVNACIGAELCFDIPVSNPDPIDYTVSWRNNGLAGATFVDASTGLPAPFTTSGATATPTGRFCWTPTANGLFFFTVRVKDDQCPLNGIQDQTYIIQVLDPLSNTTAVTRPLTNCNELQLCALPINDFQSPVSHSYSYNWSGNGNFDTSNQYVSPFLTDSCLAHVYPASGNYFYDLELTDMFGCQFNYRGFTTVVGQVEANAGADLTVCSGFPYALGSPALPNQTYSWSPATNLSDPTSAQPSFLSSTINQPDTFKYEVLVTDVNDPRCTARDFVKVVVNANLSVSVLPNNPRICRGGSVTLTASGGTTYQWSNQPAPGGNTITFSPRSSTVVSVAAFEKGCTSPPTLINVTVDPGPQGFLTGDTRVCEGENTIILASGGDTYRWSTPNANGNILVLNNIAAVNRIWVIPIDAGGCEGDTVFAEVDSYDLPAADFTVDRVCEGMPTQFTDATTLTEGVVTSWSWDFGDPSSGTANTSIQENPTHIFSAPGTYTVTLEVGTNNGCLDIITQQVTVDAIPAADFEFQNVCEGLSHNFTNTSIISLGMISDYTWRFGDGNSSNIANPNHQYGAPTFYNVTLVAETPNGCVDSVTQTVLYHPKPIASFDVLSACQDSVVFAFNGASVGGGLDEVNQWFWDFGDPASPNNNSVWDNPRHVYENAGSATIQLTVTTANGCVDDTTAEVAIHETPISGFTVQGNCENTPVLFIQQGSANPATPLARWNWDFGQGDKADTRSATVSFREVGAGVYPVRLEVITTEGCRKTAIQDVIINHSPQVRFAYEDVCIGQEMLFRSKTQIDSSGALPGALASWAWDFGGAGQGVISGPEVDYIYDAPGDYMVRLSVTSDSGCVSFQDREVTVNELPDLPDLTAESVCFSSSARLLAATNQTVAVNWYTSSTATEPFHTGNSYVTPPLPYTTTYYVEPVSAEGCINSRQPIVATVFDEAEVLLSTSRAFVELPLGVIEFDTRSSVPIVEWNWDFGEGTTSTLAEPVHEYSEPGKYEVNVVVTDERGCSYTRNAVIEVTKTIGDFFPTAFSPNSDGFNDVYTIGAYNLIDFQITIFNRWGNEVFTSGSADFQWNGLDTNGKEVPEGVYVYLARFLDTNGKMTEKKGTITLIR